MANDEVFEVYGDNTTPISIDNRTITPDRPVQDTLKFSHANNATVQNCVINGGSEDAVDMNRGTEDVLIFGSTVNSGGKYCFTIKDSRDIWLTDVVIGRHGSEIDIDLGNWSDTHVIGRTKKVTLHNVKSLDGRPVRVRVGNADWPIISGGNCKIDYIGSFLLKAYVLLKGWGLLK